MKDFRFLDYCTEYSCYGDIYKDMDREACFGHVFRNVHDNYKVHYQIIIRKGVDFCKDKHLSNACLFDRRAIKNHINQLKTIYPLKSTVVSKDDRFIVDLDIENVPGSFHKYALTWVRYLYEFPYNMILMDAYKLKQDPIFRFTSISDLFNLGIGCYCDTPRIIHQVPRNYVPKRMKKRDIREKIRRVTQLNNIYTELRRKTTTIPEMIGEVDIRDIEYWTVPENFQRRKEVYLKVYKKDQK